MSTVRNFNPSANITGRADAGMEQRKVAGEALNSVFPTSFYLGSVGTGTLKEAQAGFWRYEFDIPTGATILGIQFKPKSTGAQALGPITMSGGFLKRQETARPWENASGCLTWTDPFDVPLWTFNSATGVVEDNTIWWGEAPGFSDVSLANQPSVAAHWSIGEGTLTGGTAGDVTGLVAQLQSYLDDPGNEATRGDTQAGSIAVMLMLSRHFTGTDNQYQYLYSVDNFNTALWPHIRVEWGFPPVVTITNPSSSPTVSSGTNINFVATSIDTDDGDISSGVAWTSDLDGAIGTSASINVSTLSIGTHLVTATSTDSDGQIGTDTLVVIVEVAPGVPIEIPVTVPDPSVIVKRDLDAAPVLSADPNVIIKRSVSPVAVLIGSNSIVIKQPSANIDIEIDEG